MSEGTTPRPRPLTAGPDTTASAAEGVPRPEYECPRLERLGGFQALTLQQSVPIGPGSFLPGGKSPFA